jgi:hypothetical protein
MSITINHQTNDISGVGGSVTINGNAVPTTSLTGVTQSSGSFITSLGAGAGQSGSGGAVTIGYQAGQSNSYGGGGVHIGYQAGKVSIGGNVTIGNSAGLALSYGPYCTIIGTNAGTTISSASRTTIIGAEAGKQCGNVDDLTAIGNMSGFYASGNASTLLGSWAGYYSGGIERVALGAYSMRGSPSWNSTGAYSVGVGAYSLFNYTSGEKNVAIGHSALYSATTSKWNVAIGHNAGYGLTTASDNNVIIGYLAGYTGTNNLTASASNNIIIGASAEASTSNATNEITLGNSSITRFRIPGVNIYANNNALGIGSTALTTGWNTSARVVDFSTVGMGLTGAGHGFISYNAQNTTISGESWTYRANDEAGLLQLNTDGTLNYYTAASGTAGNAISFSRRFQVGVNYTILDTSLIVGNGRTGEIQLGVSNNNRFLYYYLAPDGGNFGVWDTNGSYNRFYSDVSGNFWIRGTLTQNSDETLKTNWRSLPSDFVNKLATVKSGLFDRIDMDNKTVVGLSAQSLQTVLPQAVHKDEKGILSVEYATTAAVATVELAKKVVEQEARIAQLEALVNNLIKNGV